MFLSSGRRNNSASTWTNDWLLDLARTRSSVPAKPPTPPRALSPSSSSSDGRRAKNGGAAINGHDIESNFGSDDDAPDRFPDGQRPLSEGSEDDRPSSQHSRASSDSDLPPGAFDSSKYFSELPASTRPKRSSHRKAPSLSPKRRQTRGIRCSPSSLLKGTQLNLRYALDELEDAKKMVELLTSINSELENQTELLRIQVDDVTSAKDTEIESLCEQLDQAHFKLRKAERRNRYVDDADRWKADAKYRRKQQDTTQLLFGFPSYEADERKEEILKERRGAQGLVAKSVTVVTAMMDRFNEDLFQTAASCSDRIENMGFEKASMSSASKERAERVLGTKLVSIVLPTIPKVTRGAVGSLNPLLLQVVIQTFLVYWCNSIIESWYPKQPTFAEFLVDVSSKLKVGSNSKVCGTKTMITQKHTRESTNLFGDWVQDIVEDLSEVLSIFGWHVEQDRSTSTGASGSIPPSIHDPILNLVKAAYDIRTAMAEVSTSGDVDLVIISCDTPFNELWMEDSYDDFRASRKRKVGAIGSRFDKTEVESVVGTTGIGLQREILRTHAESGTVSRDLEMVLKPRVVLEYTLLEAFL